MQLIFEIFYHTVLESLNAAFDLFIKLRYNYLYFY